MSKDEDDNLMVNMESEQVSLSDLAGVDFSDVAELRFSALPDGQYVFDVQAGDDTPKLAAIGTGDKAKPAAVFLLTVINVLAVKNAADLLGEPVTSLIGKGHRETFFITDQKSVGYVKAFVADIGGDNTGPMGGIPSKGKIGFLDKSAGLRFSGFIGHRADKNDSDKVYVNINRNKGKIIPMARPVSGVDAAVAGS